MSDLDRRLESIEGRLAIIEWALYSLLGPCAQDAFIEQLRKHHPNPVWLKRMHLGEFDDD